MFDDKKIRVMVIDDFEPVRKYLRMLLGSVPEFEVVGEAEDGNKAMELVRKLRPNIVIMDVHMPGTNGIEVTKWIKSKFSDIRIIAHTSSIDKYIKNQMFKAGASAFLQKDCGCIEVISTIKSVFENQ